MVIKERPYVREKIEMLLERYNCDLEELDKKCHLYSGARKQVEKMVREKRNENQIVC